MPMKLSKPNSKEGMQMSDKVYYWSDLADLNHDTQVEEFGFCLCEDGPPSYDNCPI